MLQGFGIDIAQRMHHVQQAVCASLKGARLFLSRQREEPRVRPQLCAPLLRLGRREPCERAPEPRVALQAGPLTGEGLSSRSLLALSGFGGEGQSSLR